MKTLQEIKDEVAKEYKFTDWEDLMRNTGDRVQDRSADEATHLFAKEVAREALKNAADNACLIESIRNSAVYDKIDKSSILNEKNIPEL